MSESVSFYNLLAVLAVAFAVSVVMTPLVRNVAIRFAIGDKPNGRRVHIRMIPHLGGVALVLGVFSALLISGLVPEWGNIASVKGVATGALPALTLVILLGLVDDMKSLRAMHKLLVQIVAAVILVVAGFVLHTNAEAAVTSGVVVLSIVFFIGMPSAVNLVDGHDGLAGGMCLISAAAFAVIAQVTGAGILAVTSLALAGACLGFLVFNFPPGSIYMGDTGSLFLGTMLALTASALTMLAPSINMFVAVCLVLGVPTLDAMLAIVRRLALRSPVFGADSLHIHHVLNQAGFSPRQVLAVIWSMQAILAALGVVAVFGFVLPVVIGATFLLTAFVWFLRQMIAVRPVGGRAALDISPGSIPLRGDHSVELTQRTSLGR